MKKILQLAITTLCMQTLAYSAIDNERFKQSEEAVQTALYGHIDAKGLQALIDSKTPFVLLDARGNKWHDHNRIPGAILASYETPDEELVSIIGDQETLVVLYCFSFTCPLSERLAKKLVALGYTNVIEYPAGLQEWRDIAGYPVDVIE